MPNLSGPNLGGGFNGISPPQIVNGYKDSGDALTRKCLRKAWNTQYATGTVNGLSRVTTPFRAVNNLGDFRARVDYSCGGPNQVNQSYYNRGGHLGFIPQHCDGTGVPPSTCNTKFASDSSDYIRYRREHAVNLNYNDSTNAGNKSNGSYVFDIGIKRGLRVLG